MVIEALSNIPGLGRTTRSKKMSNERIQEIITTCYLHHEIASIGVDRHAGLRLMELEKRMNRHLDYYSGTSSITSTFHFLSAVLSAWYGDCSVTAADVETVS